MDRLTERSLQCVVVTPERAVLDKPVDFIALPMYDGELGVLPGRAPLIGRLGPGELRIRRGETIERLFVDGGFAQVRSNVVTVLTPHAIKGEEINVERAEQALETAQTPALSLEAQQTHVREQARARAQIRIAHRARGEA
jgi:F-type H+-transporting ATPase subunit epsilon